MPQTSDAFSSEAEMYGPLASRTHALADGHQGAIAFHQVKASAGIPDLILAAFDESELFHRQENSLEPVVDAVDVATLLQLGSIFGGNSDTSAAQLSALVGVSPGYLSSTVLPRLASGGHVRRVARGLWHATHAFRPSVTFLATVEAKRANWRQALWQARRHAQGADLAWVIMEERAASPAIRSLDWFANSCIGLATVSAEDQFKIYLSAKRRPDRMLERMVLAERALFLHQQGSRSWAWASLFGSHG
jgi:hypothetical protein